MSHLHVNGWTHTKFQLDSLNTSQDIKLTDFGTFWKKEKDARLFLPLRDQFAYALLDTSNIPSALYMQIISEPIELQIAPATLWVAQEKIYPR